MSSSDEEEAVDATAADDEEEVAGDDTSEDDDDDAPPLWRQGWVRVVAGLVLAAALLFGLRSFLVADDLKSVERQIAAGQYDAACQTLDAVLAKSPASERALLLKMKAEFLRGNWSAAGALAQQHAGESMQGDLAAEVAALSQRVQAALRKRDEAQLAFRRGDIAAADAAMTEALSLYPESVELQEQVENLRANAAFQAKDYPRFLAVTEESARRRPESFVAQGMLASALAAQYAATGEASFRTRALEALDKAKALSERTPGALALYEEYQARIHHRLDTREIIDRAEYDRRFRATRAP